MIPRLILLLCIVCSPLLHATELSPYRAVYSVEKARSEVARATHQLRISDKHLHMSHHSELIGLLALFRDDRIDERSDILIDAAGWRLAHYRYHQSGDGGGRDTQFDVDWSRQANPQHDARVVGRHEDNSFTLDTSEELWDPLSVLLALQRDVADDRRQYRYTVIRRGEARTYEFEKRDEQTLEIDEESYDTVRLVREHGRRTTMIWLSRDKGYVPVRIQLLKDGEVDTSMSLISLSR